MQVDGTPLSLYRFVQPYGRVPGTPGAADGGWRAVSEAAGQAFGGQQRGSEAGCDTPEEAFRYKLKPAAHCVGAERRVPTSSMMASCSACPAQACLTQPEGFRAEEKACRAAQGSLRARAEVMVRADLPRAGTRQFGAKCCPGGNSPRKALEAGYPIPPWA